MFVGHDMGVVMYGVTHLILGPPIMGMVPYVQNLREAKPGCFQTRVFPTFFGNGPDCVADPFGTVPPRCS